MRFNWTEWLDEIHNSQSGTDMQILRGQKKITNAVEHKLAHSHFVDFIILNRVCNLRLSSVSHCIQVHTYTLKFLSHGQRGTKLTIFHVVVFVVVCCLLLVVGGCLWLVVVVVGCGWLWLVVVG